MNGAGDRWPFETQFRDCLPHSIFIGTNRHGNRTMAGKKPRGSAQQLLPLVGAAVSGEQSPASTQECTAGLTAPARHVDALAGILDDPKAENRRLREQRVQVLSEGRRRQLQALKDAWDERFPQMGQFCSELGRRPTDDEHFTIWASRLKRWGDAVRDGSCRARNVLRGFRPPPDLGHEQLRAFELTHYVALRAADSDFTVTDIERALRRACTEENAHLLKNLYLPGEWLGRIHDSIERAVKKEPRHARITNHPNPGKNPDNAFQDLLEFASDKLKGNQRTAVEMLCAKGGKVPVKDMALKFDWDNTTASKNWSNLVRELKIKVKSKKLPYNFRQQANYAVVERLPQS
jgi:hypothetical protein